MFGKKKDLKQDQLVAENGKEAKLTDDSKSLLVKVNKSRKEEPKMANLTTDADIKGTIEFGQTMRIDGNVEGELITDNGELFIGKTGKVKAEVKVRSAIIEGRVVGNIIASDKVELKQNAHLIGDLQAKTLVVEKGVVFVGKCNVNPEETKKENQRYKDVTKEERVEQIIFNRFINQ